MANDERSNVFYKSIDENLLTDLVKERPVVWDLTEDNYRKRVACDQAWEEILKRLFPGYEYLQNDRKTSLAKDVKKKWTNLRDCYNKSRKVGKDSVSKYKSLDFLAKVYDEKEKRSSSFVSPSKDTKSSMLVADPDADTQVNSSIQSRRDRASYSQAGNQATSASLPLLVFSKRPRDGVNSRNVKDECVSPESDSDDEDANDEKLQCSTTSVGEDSAQSNVRSSRKRHLEEIKEEAGDDYIDFLQFVKKTLTKNFNRSQTKRFKSEIIQLMDSVSNDFDDAELEEFNIEMLKILLNKTNVKEICKQIIDCTLEAEKALDE